jgi:GNAT superfamily N-acetyltransferase
MELVVRRASSKDSADLARLTIRSIREICAKDYADADLSSWLENKTPANFSAWAKSKDHSLYVAECQGIPSGVGLFSHDGWIRLCYVLPEALKKGAGRALMAAMEAEACKRGLKRLELESTRTALKFYLRLGYVAGKRGKCSSCPTVEATYMTKDLDGTSPL